MNGGLDHVRLREKMLILYFLAVLAPILLTNIVFYWVTTENVRNQRISDTSQAVEQLRNDFQAEIDDAIGVSSVIHMDYLLSDILETEYSHPADYVNAYDSYIRRILNSYTPVYHAVQSIMVYVNNPTIVPEGGSIFQINQAVMDTPWYQAFSKHEESYPLLMRTETINPQLGVGNGARDTFSIIRDINYFSSRNSWTKILKIDLRADSVRHIFSNLNLLGDVYLINDEGIIEYTTRTDIDWRREDVTFDFLRSHDNQKRLDFVSAFPQANHMSGWKIVASVTEEELYEDVRASRDFVIYLTILIIIVPTLVIIWIVKSLNVRIIRLLKHMKKATKQHFEPIEQMETNDEIGQLTSEFNRMVLQIKQLINDVYIADIQSKQSELQRRQAQLKALQSQINPHFIFNALETIRMRSLMKGERETAKIIHNMAKMMRNSLTWRKDMVTVREELDLVQCFLEIQQYRFADKLRYEVVVDEQALNYLLPKMSVLPFVENASIHGIEPQKDGGTISLHVHVKSDWLYMELADNGRGMSEEKKAELLSFLISDEEMGDRIGVQNVIYRLRMHYPQGFDLQILSEQGKGTTIRMKLPLGGGMNQSL